METELANTHWHVINEGDKSSNVSGTKKISKNTK